MRVLLVAVAMLMTVGCASVNKQFADGVDGYTQTILPEYKTYIAKDSSLDESTKKVRTQSADRLQALVDEAKKGAK